MRALREQIGGKVQVAAKARPVVRPRSTDDAPRFRGRLPEWYLRDSVEASLRRLAVERLDRLRLRPLSEDGVQALDWLDALTLHGLRDLATERTRGLVHAVLHDGTAGGHDG